MPRAEDLIRDYLPCVIGDLPSLVVNLAEVRENLERREQAFFDIPPDDGGPSAHDLLQRILLKRNLVGLGRTRPACQTLDVRRIDANSE